MWRSTLRGWMRGVVAQLQFRLSRPLSAAFFGQYYVRGYFGLGGYTCGRGGGDTIVINRVCSLGFPECKLCMQAKVGVIMRLEAVMQYRSRVGLYAKRFRARGLQGNPHWATLGPSSN